MSQVYSTEPNPTGRLVLETTHGPIDIQLFCKECPTTCRTFLQLCLDGYFTDMIWHRCLDNFLIQTGLTRDETMTGNPVEDMEGYLKRSSAVPAKLALSGDGGLGWDRKKFELNPRIRFNHRGQVAMALPLDDGKNGGNVSSEESAEKALLRYQFFVTLDEAPFLDAKHVIFGTVSGPTIFNALRIGRTDVDEGSGVPIDLRGAPPRIKNVKIDHHPFQDLVVTSDKSIPWKRALKGSGKGGDRKDAEQSAIEKRRKKRKGKRDLNVLSFGDEERDYEEIVGKNDKSGDPNKKGSKNTSIQSSHDVLANESEVISPEVDVSVKKRVKDQSNEERDRESGLVGDEESKKRKLEKNSEPLTIKDAERNVFSPATQSGPSKGPLYNQQNESMDVPFRENTKREHKKSRHDQTTKSKTICEVEARRAKYLKRGTGSSAKKSERLRREDDTMKKLLAFKTKVLETKGSKTNGLKRNGDSDAEKKSVDDSLAARMAKRTEEAKVEEEKRRREKEAMESAPGYSGQVLSDEGDGGVSDGDNADSGNWMGAKFKCKRHMDHDSRSNALDNIGDAGNDKDLGGDGRRMDDYMVIDEKGCGRSDKGGRGRDREHHTHRSMHHAGRVHRHDGHNTR
mmetsp:Transcript_27499/g.57765  ORF Transcript_27499/g.57765 Transcript_27499/m.57765 type:complete len:625 (-) Transcript_27499:15-1889(-)